MDLGIAGKVAMVIGGSKGMGRDAAHMLAAERCPVAIVARTKADVDKAVDSIRQKGGRAIGIMADITDRDDVQRAVAEVCDEFGPPLIVIGQTKFIAPGDFADLTDAEPYVESFRTYTVSQIHLLHAALPGMRDAGWGRFVHLGSATAKEPVNSIRHAIANASRPSTTGLLKTVADEYAQYGITVNTVAPGWIETESAVDYMRTNLGLRTEEDRRDWILHSAGVPAARMGRSDEIASVIVYLCSEQAGYITGAWIEVDGGHHRAAF